MKLKSKFLLLLVAAVPAALMPLTAAGQVAPEHHRTTERGAITYKYQAFAGLGYTGLNQVGQSRHGLYGGTLAVTRDVTRHFGVTANGDYYKPSLSSGNPGNPSVLSVTVGPEVKMALFGNMEGFAHILLGVEHTGGENMTPTASFSSGFGAGVIYNLSPHWATRLSGDRQSDSFSFRNNSTELGNSPHTHYNARMAVGVVYRF
ncbi:hypothetical protein ACOBR2_12880 [Telmatobacter bradus]|uniref:hypothetical protein n=1 Tax=Telmatobacter bradus TaxID=474953 RepID=UPI003B42DC32